LQLINIIIIIIIMRFINIYYSNCTRHTTWQNAVS